MEANTRYGYLDSVAGLLILHMIAFHIFRGDVYGTRAEECMRPLSFFMFWFFYKSGMFFKPRTCYEVLRKGWEKLLVPYLVFSIVGFLVWCLIQTVISGFDILSFSEQAILEFAYAGTLPGNVPLWFLPSLLIVQILFNTIYKSGGGMEISNIYLHRDNLCHPCNRHSVAFLSCKHTLGTCILLIWIYCKRVSI